MITQDYYLARTRRLIGPNALELAPILVGRYLRELGVLTPGRYDGTSVFSDGRMRIVVGCDGKGTGKTVTYGPNEWRAEFLNQ